MLLSACLIAMRAPADLLADSETLSYSADGNSVLLQVPHHHCGDIAGAAAAGAAIGPAIGTIVGSMVAFRPLPVEFCVQR